jgi:hypothetical protein
LTDERARCESSTRIAWEGDSLPVHNIPEKIANEADAARRRELTARWIDALASCNDLRGARLNSFHDESRTLGTESYRALFADIKRVDYGQLSLPRKVSRTNAERLYCGAR